MRFKIYGEDKNGMEDSVVVSGDTLDICIAIACQEAKNRNWNNCLSEIFDTGTPNQEYI